MFIIIYVNDNVYVSLVFSEKGFGLVFLKIGLGLGLVFVSGLGLGFTFEFGFSKLIGGAVGTVGCGSRKPPVTDQTAYVEGPIRRR